MIQRFQIDDPVAGAKKLRRQAATTEVGGVERIVKEIIEKVKLQGDKALLELTKKLDHVDVEGIGLSVASDEVERAYLALSDEQIEALKALRERITRVERCVLKGLEYSFIDKNYGVRVRGIARPIPSVGCYVPGRRAAYPSSLLMTVGPAKVAGVPKTVVCTPPGKGGRINPLILVAADVVGVDKIYRVGGAQAIAALAYGTESIEPVKKIVGPGNIYVKTAKTIVSSFVSIDFPAGPTELIILADDTADPDILVLDLIAQAEHDPRSVVGLATNSLALAEETELRLREALSGLPRGDIISRALSEYAFICVFRSLKDCFAFVNAFAPEHLEMLIEDGETYLQEVNNVGLITLGEYAFTSLSDYCLGTNHVLPTCGYAETHSGLSVRNFVKVIQVATAEKKTLKKCHSLMRILTDGEGLPNHLTSLEGRLRG